MIDEVKAAAKDGDSLGGVVEVLGYGIPIGLGSHVHWDRKIDAALAQAVMSIQAVKGVELGDGFEAPAVVAAQHTTPSCGTTRPASIAARQRWPVAPRAV